MSRTTRILLLALPLVMTVAVIGYAVWAVADLKRPASIQPAAEVPLASGTAQPLNAAAPMVVAETLAPTGSRPRRGTIIFDMSHSEVFGPQDTSELGQSAAVDRMRAAGYAVRVNTEKFSASAIGTDVAAVFLPGPMVPLMDKERSALDDFVRRGGTVVLTVHVPYPIMGTPARYGLPVGKGVMIDPNLSGDPGVWTTQAVKADPLTTGVREIQVVSGWGLGTSPSEIADPRIVIEAPSVVVVDSNNDGRFSKTDDQPPYGVVGVADIGSGRVVVLGDDAIFANLAIGMSDNARLLDNLLELVSAPKPA